MARSGRGRLRLKQLRLIAVGQVIHADDCSYRNEQSSAYPPAKRPRAIASTDAADPDRNTMIDVRLPNASIIHCSCWGSAGSVIKCASRDYGAPRSPLPSLNTRRRSQPRHPTVRN
jgi:hypothetical protein